MVDTIMVEMEPPFEIIVEVFIVEAVRVDVLTVTKLAVARALLVFIFPTRLRLLMLAVCVLRVLVIIPPASMIVEDHGAPLLVGQEMKPVGLSPVRLPVMFIDDRVRLEESGAG
jgi:hypothetical protein